VLCLVAAVFGLGVLVGRMYQECTRKVEDGASDGLGTSAMSGTNGLLHGEIRRLRMALVEARSHLKRHQPEALAVIEAALEISYGRPSKDALLGAIAEGEREALPWWRSLFRR
jgi:hypothetical protein